MERRKRGNMDESRVRDNEQKGGGRRKAIQLMIFILAP